MSSSEQQHCHNHTSTIAKAFPHQHSHASGGNAQAFSGGATPWADCGVWQAPGSGHVFSVGLCANGRDPPTSLDEAAVTVTLVETSRAAVDAWHKLLAASPRANVTNPGYSKAFEVCVCVSCE